MEKVGGRDIEEGESSQTLMLIPVSFVSVAFTGAPVQKTAAATLPADGLSYNAAARASVITYSISPVDGGIFRTDS